MGVGLSGANVIGRARSREGDVVFRAVDPATGVALDPEFADAIAAEIHRAAMLAESAFPPFAATSGRQRAGFLRAIAEELLALGDPLLDRAGRETGLPRARLEGERGRTVNQLRLFAELLEEGSWVDARIDRGDPARTPIPKPDLRTMLVPLGPVAVFGASNFPLAFSVAGGDTVSAFAAGCPVVVKAHPGHPGTSELAAQAILLAVEKCGMPDGVFSMLQGAAHGVGQALVTHPLVKAVGFTGSLAGGRALFDAASRRPEPIPVYAEMGSSNPVFVLPRALAARGEAIADGLAASVVQGAGQFCTNPGLTILAGGESGAFLGRVGAALGAAPAGTMVHAGIRRAYDAALAEVGAIPGVVVAARAPGGGDAESAATASTATPALLVTDAASFLASRRLEEEIYGPSTVAVRCSTKDETLALARSLHGHLTATIHGTAEDLAEYAELVAILRGKVGRLLFGGFPTGVEVGHAMQHGGPYPATTDSRSTSVGTAAIRRFARPVCNQNAPEAALPPELQAANPLGIWRLVDGRFTKDAL